MLTTMSTARPVTLLSAVLLIYPATLLLGSLFSAISPTARHSRDLSDSFPQPAGPLAPSLASDLYLSDGPVNYFARKNNIFNVYFVKIGWLWTTAAFASLLIFQPLYASSHRESLSQQEARFRRTLQAILRYTLATTVWYLATQWFFGPPVIDRSFVATGGKCEQAIEEVGRIAAGQSSATGLDALFTATTCKAAGGAWRGGHDISGHVLMLVLATGVLAFEAVGASACAPACLSRSDPGDAGRERKASDADSTPIIDSIETAGFARTWSLRLVWGIIAMGWWMLLMTAIWFHTWLERVCAFFGKILHDKILNLLMIPLVVWSVDWFGSCVCHLYSSKTDSTIGERNWTSGSIDVCFACEIKFSAAASISNDNDRLH